MPVLPMHLHECSNRSSLRLIVIERVGRTCGYISVATGVTTRNHLPSAFCKCLFYLGCEFL